MEKVFWQFTKINLTSSILVGIPGTISTGDLGTPFFRRLSLETNTFPQLGKHIIWFMQWSHRAAICFWNLLLCLKCTNVIGFKLSSVPEQPNHHMHPVVSINRKHLITIFGDSLRQQGTHIAHDAYIILAKALWEMLLLSWMCRKLPTFFGTQQATRADPSLSSLLSVCTSSCLACWEAISLYSSFWLGFIVFPLHWVY